MRSWSAAAVLCVLAALAVACGGTDAAAGRTETPRAVAERVTPVARSSTASPTAGSAAGKAARRATSVTAPSVPAPGAATPQGARRPVPRPGTSWQWQLSGPIDLSVKADVFDIDGEGNTPETVTSLHRAGRYVICYVNAGADEDFRADHGAFPRTLVGSADGWSGEHYVDIRRRDVLEPIMYQRFASCAGKGFDAVEADLVDTYQEKTGFPLTGGDQLAYNRMLARVAHQLGLAIGLKNDLSQVPDLLGDFDFSINEQCVEYSECAALVPFIKAGKPVFHAEYNVPPARFCPVTRPLGFSSIGKELALGPSRTTC